MKILPPTRQSTDSLRRESDISPVFSRHSVIHTLLALAVVFLLLGSLNARSAIETWKPLAGGGSGSWDTTTKNWAANQLWANGNDALFTGTGGTVALVMPSANSLTFSASGPYLLTGGTLTLTGSDVTANSNATIASTVQSGDFVAGGSGTLTMTGAATSGGDTIVGNGVGGTMTLSGSNSSLTVFGDLYVGNSGVGMLSITGGGLVFYGSQADGFGGTIGENAGANGTLTISGSGSTLDCSYALYLGDFGSGTLQVINGGTVTTGQADYNAIIGNNSGSNGTATVSGNGSTWTITYGLDIGESGSGALVISGGGKVTEDIQQDSLTDMFVGDQAGSSGMVTVSGSGSILTLSVNSNLLIGESGSGALLVTNGGTVVNNIPSAGGFCVIGDQVDSSGAVTVSGSGSLLENNELEVGVYGSGTLSVMSGGTVTVFGVTTIGDETVFGSPGFVTVTGTGSTLTSGTYGGSALRLGDGSLSITNGGTVTSGVGDIGDNGTNGSVVTVFGTGAKWTIKNELDVGFGGNATLSISNGGAVSDSQSSVGNSYDVTAIVTVSGTASTWTNTAGIYISCYDYSNGTQATGGAGLLYITSGGSVSATETTVFSPGILELEENPALNSPIIVNGGSLSLADGQVQTVTLTNPLEIEAGSNLNFDVGSGSDKIVLSGSNKLTLTGTAAVSVFCISGQVTSGTDVIIAAATSGSLSLGNVYNGGNFTYKLVSTSTSEDVVVTAAVSPLTTAYWKGGQNNLWSVLVGGTATNWTTAPAGTIDPQLTPSATTDVNFSASTSANESNTVLGTSMTIKSLTVSDTNAVMISGYDPNLWMETDTLAISGSTGTTGINVNSGAGQVTIQANVYLGGNSQTIAVNNAEGLVISGSLGSSNGLAKSGTGILTLTGWEAFTGPTSVINGTMILGGTLANTVSVAASNATLELSATDAINSTARLTLSNGVLNARNNPQKIADLTVTGASALDLGVGSNTAIVAFAASNTDLWEGTLTILNWNGDSDGGGPDQVFFGSNSTGLTTTELGDIHFFDPTIDGVSEVGNYYAAILSDGEIVAAVPEPGTWGMFGSGILILIGIQRWRKRSVEAYHFFYRTHSHSFIVRR